jgi:stage V sporulation protein R
VEVLKEKGKYELYPSNPYETVINTRPAISFYNDNNPDWLNVMIFYHVLAHIDFFQNNLFFRHTWDYDFTGQALSDKRVVARLRAEKGRWADYIIEFTRGIDNLVGYHEELARFDRLPVSDAEQRLDFYFDTFLQTLQPAKVSEYIGEIERYNQCRKDFGDLGGASFFSEVERRCPEFEALFKKSRGLKPARRRDLTQFLMEHSDFLNKEENTWMQTIMQVVRKTSLFFQPQIRTKIMNEGWASYWHETLFLQDERIKGHEVDYARVNAKVTALPRVGLNPYALGMRMFAAIEERAAKGSYSFDFQRLQDAHQRRTYDGGNGHGREFIRGVRENLCDFMFIDTFLDQDFMDRYRLFVAGRRLNRDRMVWEYYVKSRSAEDYRRMLADALYHPPHIEIDPAQNRDGGLYLVHRFEGKPLVREYIANTLLGIAYLWNGPVHLETSEVQAAEPSPPRSHLTGLWVSRPESPAAQEIKWQRVRYTMDKRRLTRKPL